jgi:hypothetical protein
MDGNADGRVERSEVVRYVTRLADELGECIELSVGGVPLELVELHEPEVDLLGHDRVSVDITGCAWCGLRSARPVLCRARK